MSADYEFDVFLAHHSADKPLVREISDKLKQRGLKPWIDEEQIAPGRSFQQAIQQAIPTVKTAAILLGKDGIGRWQQWEIEAFFSQCTKNDTMVIPVLLPGISEVPDSLVFLQQLRWINFNSTDDKNALGLLIWGITGKRQDESVDSTLSTLNEVEGFKHTVFLCHNSKEKEQVSRIRSQLRERGIYGWLDKYDFEPMRPWADQLEEVLPQIQAAAIFIGASGVGPWANIEMREFLVEFANRNLRIGLVLLPGCPDDLDTLSPPVPKFLKSLHWIDFRNSKPDPLEQLVWGITGQKPQGLNASPTNPFETDTSANLSAPVDKPAELTAEDWFDRALSKQKLGDHQGAVGGYTQAIKLKPDYADAFKNRGDAFIALDDRQRAAIDYQQAAKLYQQPRQEEDYKDGSNQPQILHKFDAFLAHNSKDKPQVTIIAEELRRQNLRPWIDEDEIDIGDDIQKKITEGIQQSRVAIFFIGIHGFGKFQDFWELSALIMRCSRKQVPFFPVLLPGVEELPDELDLVAGRKYLKFTQVIGEEELNKEGLNKLVQAIKKHRQE